MLDQSAQKRRFIRVGDHLPVTYRIRGEQESFQTVTENVSIGGAALKTDRFIALRTALDIDLNVGSRLIHAVGKVAWAAHLPHSDRIRIGVEFVECDPFDAERLTDFIEKQTVIPPE